VGSENLGIGPSGVRALPLAAGINKRWQANIVTTFFRRCQANIMTTIEKNKKNEKCLELPDFARKLIRKIF
jgi:hypothetical protein